MQWLEAQRTTNTAMFMAMLATELGNAANQPVMRQQAGLQLKNCLASREDGVTEQHEALWLNADPAARAHIKAAVMSALGTEAEGFLSAPQVAATIAIIEIPRNMWPELVPALLQQCGRCSGGGGGGGLGV